MVDQNEEQRKGSCVHNRNKVTLKQSEEIHKIRELPSRELCKQELQKFVKWHDH